MDLNSEFLPLAELQILQLDQLWQVCHVVVAFLPVQKETGKWLKNALTQVTMVPVNMNHNSKQ